MPRFIVRFRGSGQPPDADVDQIRNLPEMRVIDGSSRRMMLVDVPEQHLRNAIDSMPGWAMFPEETVELPDPRPGVSKDPPDSDK